MWPGGEYEYNGVTCTFTQTFEAGCNFERKIDKIMDWFNHEKTPANLVMLYIEEPDGSAHVYGPDSVEVCY